MISQISREIYKTFVQERVYILNIYKRASDTEQKNKKTVL